MSFWYTSIIVGLKKFLFCFVLFSSLPYFLPLCDTLRLSCILTAPVLESAISSRIPGSILFKNSIRHQNLGSCSLLLLFLLGPLSWQSKEIYVFMLIHVYIHINKHFYKQPHVYVKLSMSSYWCLFCLYFIILQNTWATDTGETIHICNFEFCSHIKKDKRKQLKFIL